METLEKSIIVTKKDLESLLKEIWPGGTMIIENRATLGVEFILHAFIEYSERKGVPLVVQDIFDTFPLYFTHLKMMGVPLKDEVTVIKVGGIQEVGKVLGKIKFENDPNVYQRKLENELLKVSKGKTYIHLVLGLERLLFLQNDIHSAHALVNFIKQKLGDQKGINVYVLETRVLEGLNFNPLPLFEDAATSVIELTDNGELINIRLKKSTFTLLTTKDHVMLSPKEVLNWWSNQG